MYTNVHNTPEVETTQKCPSNDEWINKMWYSHTIECYSEMKMNGKLMNGIR